MCTILPFVIQYVLSFFVFITYEMFCAPKPHVLEFAPCMYLYNKDELKKIKIKKNCFNQPFKKKKFLHYSHASIALGEKDRYQLKKKRKGENKLHKRFAAIRVYQDLSLIHI